MAYFLIGAAAFLTAVAASFWITRSIKRAARGNNWLDEPSDDRKIHQRPTPTAGGLGIAAGLIAGVGVLFALAALLNVSVRPPQLAFWGGALVMLATGFIDDVHGASFKKKFFIQSAVAYGLLHAGYSVDVDALLPVALSAHQAALLTVPLTMAWVVGVMNAVNFIDGLDGLAAGVVLVAMAAFGVIFGFNGAWGLTLTAALVIGAIAGFLYHNVYPASIFMGDSGSLLLGYFAAVFPLVAPLVDGDPIVNVLVPIVVLGLPILDTVTSIARRMLDRRSIFAPDKDHIHHRLMRRWPEPEAVGGMYLAASWFGIAALLMAIVPPLWAYVVCGATAVIAVAWVTWLGYFDAHLPAYVPPMVRSHGASSDRAPALAETPARPEASGDAAGNEPLQANPARPRASSRESSGAPVKASDA